MTYFTFFLILAMPTHAWAYVDPATLTYVVQIIAGVLLRVVLQLVYTGENQKLFSKDKTSVKKHESTEQERNAAAAAAEEFNEDK